MCGGSQPPPAPFESADDLIRAASARLQNAANRFGGPPSCFPWLFTVPHSRLTSFVLHSSWRPLHAVVAGCAVLLSTACGGSDSTQPPPPPPTVTTVAVTPSTATLILGAERQLSATASGDAGPISGKSFSWSSDATAVATVSNTGLVHALAAGTATITATVDGKSGNAVIQVQNPTPVLTAITPSTAVSSNNAITIVATGSAFTNGAVLEWNGVARPTTVTSATQISATLSAGDIATVGEQVVRVRNPAPGGGVSSPQTFAVTPVPVASVSIEPASPTLVPGEQRTFVATTRDASGNVLTGRTVSFATSNASVATVGASSGIVLAVASGTATITATAEGQSATANVTVRPGGLVGSTGGQVTVGHVTLDVPAGAVSANTVFTIDALVSPPSGPGVIAGSAVVLGPDGVAFTQPISVTLRWTAAQEASVTPARFAVHRWNGTTWVALSGHTIDVANRTVRGTTTNFSPLAILELPADNRTAEHEMVFADQNNSAIHVIDVNTRQRRTLVANGGVPALSPDRKSIAFVRSISGRRQIFVMNHDGSNVRQLSNGEFDDTDPSFMQSGERIVFTRQLAGVGRRVHSMSVAGDQVVQHTTGTHPSDNDPSIDATGTRLAMARSPQGGATQITTTTLDGGSAANLTPFGTTAPIWSHDGLRIAYVDQTASGNHQLRIIRIADGVITTVASFAGSIGTASWSPDGTRLVYSALGTSTGFVFQLFVVNADGTNNTPLTTVAGETAYTPSWSRN